MTSALQQIHRLIGSVVIIGVARAAAAQQTTGIAVVDSASVARAAWGRAASALQSSDTTTARSEISHAAAAWPLQPSYVWASAVLSARVHDSASTIDALGRYASLGLGRDLDAERSFAWLKGSLAFTDLRAAHDNNRRATAKSHVRATLADSTFWPEGMDYDARTHRFYVASVAHGTIAELRADGTTRIIKLVGREPTASILGVRVDPRQNLLWATTSGVSLSPSFRSADTAIAALLRIRVEDGTVERRWDLPRSRAGHTLGDLAIGPRGDVFVTDSDEPVLYRLRPNGDTLESLRNPLFRSLQGLAPSPDGKWLYLADYSYGLLRVDLALGAVARLDDAPHSTSLGCDGIAWDRGAIIAVQNGVSPARIVRFVLNPAGDRIARVELIDQNWPIADEPTIGAVVDGEFVYVANSQWEKYEGAGRRNTAKRLTAPILLAAPLPRP